VVVLTGGDPLERQDLFELIAEARAVGLTVALAPSATPLLTTEVIERCKRAGLHRLAISIDGASMPVHDRWRGVRGTFERGLVSLLYANRIDLPTQVNTTIHRGNAHELDAMANLVADVGAMMWSVFFLVPTGRAQEKDRIAPQGYEKVFEKLWQQQQRQPFAIKTTEAPFYRRFVMMRNGNPMQQRDQRMAGTNDGKGVLFVSHTGSIQPSGFLPIDCGNISNSTLVETYQQHPVFTDLRNPDKLKGKCGMCGFRPVCGGSRARSYAVLGDHLAAEPDCAFQPLALAQQVLATDGRR
jgi:radical SAM protein with 4Fe4S-binding SPASM domain